MGRKGNTADYAEELKKDYECWFTRWKEGWSDPNYPDGTGINGARGRIVYDKKELEKAGGEMPEEYFRPLPPEVPESYMARPKAYGMWESRDTGSIWRMKIISICVRLGIPFHGRPLNTAV